MIQGKFEIIFWEGIDSFEKYRFELISTLKKYRRYKRMNQRFALYEIWLLQKL
jgi:hypothetical protein